MELLISARGTLPAWRVNLDRRTLVVGRTKECDIYLPDFEVSRRHLEIVPFKDQLTNTIRVKVVDRISLNGTFVNGVRVIGFRILVDGDVIIAGGTRLTFNLNTTCAVQGAVEITNWLEELPTVHDTENPSATQPQLVDPATPIRVGLRNHIESHFEKILKKHGLAN